MSVLDLLTNFLYIKQVGDDPLSTNYSCAPAVSSIAREIYDEPDFESMTTEDIKEWVKDYGYENLAYFFNPGLNETGQTYIYRSFIYSALPISTEWKTINGTTIHLTKYKNSMDNYDEQEVKYLEWATQLFIDITVKHDADLIDGDLQIITLSYPAYYEYNLVLLTQSTGYLVFSILIVVAYMSFHLGSIFLAICALFQILMSFPLAYFFYRVIFGIEEFGVLPMLIIFVLLGVGAVKFLFIYYSMAIILCISYDNFCIFTQSVIFVLLGNISDVKRLIGCVFNKS